MSVYPIIMTQSQFTHRDNLHYPFEERGLQFGDGIYEVIRIYHELTIYSMSMWIAYFDLLKQLK